MRIPAIFILICELEIIDIDVSFYKYKNTYFMQFCSIYDYMTITLLLEYTYVCIKCINIQL